MVRQQQVTWLTKVTRRKLTLSDVQLQQTDQVHTHHQINIYQENALELIPTLDTSSGIKIDDCFSLLQWRRVSFKSFQKQFSFSRNGSNDGKSTSEPRRTNLASSFKGDANLSNSSNQQLAFILGLLSLPNLQNDWVGKKVCRQELFDHGLRH